MNNESLISSAHTLILHDQVPENADVLFFHARAKGDETGLFELAGRLYRKKIVDKIAINGSSGERFNSNVPFEAWPGKDQYLKWLKEMRIPRKSIILTDPALHTREENDKFLEISIDKGFRRAILIAQPHQLVRAMRGIVRAMDIAHYWMEVYCQAPPYTDWLEPVYGNQGMEQKLRYDHIAGEQESMKKFERNLATYGEVCKYLNLRLNGELNLGASPQQPHPTHGGTFMPLA